MGGMYVSSNSTSPPIFGEKKPPKRNQKKRPRNTLLRLFGQQTKGMEYLFIIFLKLFLVEGQFFCFEHLEWCIVWKIVGSRANDFQSFRDMIWNLDMTLDIVIPSAAFPTFQEFFISRKYQVLLTIHGILALWKEPNVSWYTRGPFF